MNKCFTSFLFSKLSFSLAIVSSKLALTKFKKNETLTLHLDHYVSPFSSNTESSVFKEPTLLIKLVKHIGSAIWTQLI